MNDRERGLIALLTDEWVSGRALANNYFEAHGKHLGYGTIYVTMSKLTDEKACEVEDREESDRRRRYFRKNQAT